MKYELLGDNFPAVRCILSKGETIRCEGGSMSWMDQGLTMKTEGGGGLGKALGRMFSGESIFFNEFTCEKDQGEIVFSSSYPGKIIPVELSEGKSIIAQKHAFLAATKGVNVEMHFKKSLGKGLFGGMGFIMQKFSGNGVVFLEIDGGYVEYDLGPDDVKLIDAPHLAMMDSTCTMDLEKVKGAKNVILGGEGLFNTRIQGPGRVWIQTMPIATLAMNLYDYMPKSD